MEVYDNMPHTLTHLKTKNLLEKFNLDEFKTTQVLNK